MCKEPTSSLHLRDIPSASFVEHFRGHTNYPLVAAIETVLDRILLALTATYASPAATKPPATTAIGYALRLMSDLVLHTQSATATEAGTTLSSTLLERAAGFVLRPCLFGNGVLWVLCCY